MNFSQKFIWTWSRKPGLSLVISFLLVIIIGATLLSLPQATVEERSLSFSDALFTATSATCVTGLIVKDTATYFSRFGQIVIIILIQLGALGIMSAGIFFIMLLGRKVSLAQEVNIKNVLGVEFVTEAMRLIRFLIVFTFIFEAVGTLFLFLRWHGQFGSIFNDFFYALFHSISSFGNAGFSLFSDSFIGFRGDVFVNAVISLLIIFGGLGFMVLTNLWDSIRSFFTPILQTKVLVRRFTTRRLGQLSLHSKIVLISSLVLIIAGTWFFYSFERSLSFSSFSPKEAILASYFQSVTARTAGFNTVNIKALSTPSHLFLIALMFIGGAPGSTAGGIKVTTFFLLLIMTYSIIRGRKEYLVFRRRILREVVEKAMAITLISFFLVGLFCILLSFTEEAPLEDIVFEAVSAFGTVGLSTGLTPSLSILGKLLITALMFIGRLGPLTLILLLAKAERMPKVSYSHEKVVIG